MNSNIVRASTRHPRHRSAMEAVGRWAGADPDQTRAAIDNLAAGKVTALLVSGPAGSGKDTLCPLVLERAGIVGAVQCRIAHGIRNEMAAIIAAMGETDDYFEAEYTICDEFELDTRAASLYLGLFFNDVHDPSVTVDVHERTENMRTALQYHGNEARADRPGYWVRPTYRTVISKLANGYDVYMTDGRFAGEVDAGRTFGVFCTRLWVPRELQIERIRARDGIEPSTATLNHPGEIGLDGYWGFDLEVDNSGQLEESVDVVADHFQQHRDRLARQLQ